MYSQEAIEMLINRIGWSELSSDLPFGLSTANKTAESEKTFNFYHSMVLVDNILASVPDADISESNFNQFLSSVRKQAVLNVLTSVLDLHADYDATKDYSSIIIEKKAIFDDAIGYTVAQKMIELYLTTNRKNFFERNATVSYQILKIELEGARDEKGNLITKGLAQKVAASISNARKILFPVVPIVKSENIW